MARRKRVQRRVRGSVFQRSDTSGGTWCIRYRAVDGRRVTRAIGPDRAQAEDALAAALAAQVQEREFGVVTVEPCTMRDFWPRFEPLLKKDRSATTLATDTLRFHVMAGWFGARLLSEIDAAAVGDFCAWLKSERGCGGPSANRYLSLLSVVMRAAIERRHARTNPVRGTKRAKESARAVPYLTPAEIERLLGTCRVDVRPLATVAVDSGLRRSELARLAWDHVDRAAGAHGALVVHKSKSGKPRIVPLTARARRVLDVLRTERRPEPNADRVFPVLSRSANAMRALSAQVGAAGKRAGFAIRGLHCLRHVYATSLVRAGCTIPTLARLMGHSTLTMALRYGGHAPKDEGFAAVALLEAAQHVAQPG